MTVAAGGDMNRNVQVSLSANVDGYQSAMQRAAQSTATLAAGVATLGKKIDDLTKRAGRRLVLFGASDIAALTAAAETYNRLDVAMTNIRATSAVTGQSVNALRGQIMSLSRSIPDSTNNIARLVGQVQELGIQGTKNIANFTETAERLAAATGTAPGELLQGIVQLNREMGTGLSTVTNYSSSLIELSKTLGVPAGAILQFSQSIAAVAQQAGYSQTQIMGLAGAFSRAGASSSAAANVFVQITSEINQAIVTNNAQLQQFGNLIGMTSQRFRAFAQSHPADALIAILNAIKNQGQAGILTLQQLGLDGPRALRAIAAVTGGQVNLAQAMNVASNAYERNNALTKSSNAAWSDLSAEMTKMRNLIQDIAIRFGGPLAHALDIMVKGVNAILGPLNSFLGMLGPIPGIVAGIGGAFLAITGTITAFSIAIIAAAGAWRALSGMTGTNTLQGFINGMRQPHGQGPLDDPRTVLFQRRIRSLHGEPGQPGQRSAAARHIYESAYGMGQRLSAPPPEDPTIAQRVMAATGRGVGAVLKFPFRKVGWEARESLDTLRHPFNYERRNTEAVNPMSVLGMWQSAQNATGKIGRGAASLGWLTGTLASDVRVANPFKVKVDADVSQAERKVEAVRAEAAKPVTTTYVFTNADATVGGTVGAAERAEQVAQAGPGFIRRGIGGATRGVGMAMDALSGLAGAVSNVVMPLGLLAAVGVPLYHEFRHLANAGTDAANNLDDLGAAIVRTAGGVYNKPGAGNPQNQTPADQVVPWSPNEVGTAQSKQFQANAGGDISQLSGRRGTNRQRIAQQLVQNIVASNGGAPLTASQQMVLRQTLIAAYGLQGAQQVYRGLNLGGLSPQAAAQQNARLLGDLHEQRGFFDRSGGYSGGMAQARIHEYFTPIANQLNAGGTQNYRQAALGLAAIGQLPGLGRNYASLNLQQRVDASSNDNVQKFREGIRSMLNQLNKGVPSADRVKVNEDQVTSMHDFMEALKHGNQRARTFAEQLEKAGLNADALASSIHAINAAMTTTAGGPGGPRLAGQAAAMGVNLADPTDVNYNRNIAALTYLNMRQNTQGVAAVTDTGALRNAIQAWQEYRRTLADNAPQVQAVQGQIDALNQSLMTQNQIFQTPAQVAQGLAGQAQSLMNQFGTSGWSGTQEQTYIQMAQGQTAAAENQLKSYMQTVHEYRIQERDAFYERNVQIRQMNHEFAEQLRQTNFQMANSFGNPAQMVQSQFTMGAQQAMIGMQRQVDMLRTSRETMDRLHQMGLSRDAIRLLGLDDPKNVEQAQRYLSDFAQNPRLIQAFNNSIKGRLKISAGIDTDMNNSKFADMKRQFDYNAKQATLAFEHAQQQTQTQINELGQQLYTNFDQLTHAALTSGLTNIQTYAQGIIASIHQVQNVTTKFLNSTNAGGYSGGGGGSPAPGGRHWTGLPHGAFETPGNLRRVGGHGVNQGFLLSSVSRPGMDMNSFGNPNLHWGKDVAVAPDNRLLSGNARLAQQMAGALRWGDGPEWAALYQIWQQESGFSTTAGNPAHAYGIPQADPGSKMAVAGRDWRTNPRTQIKWGLDYIAHTYGDPLGAWAHKARTGWYAKGGVFGSRQVIGIGENGPEAVLPLNNIGATFMAQVIGAVMSQTGINRSNYAMTHTAPRASVVYHGNVSNHIDHSTTFAGDITVQAQDPNEMQRKLEQRARLQRLKNPGQP